MTSFENEQWQITAGEKIKAFDIYYGKIAINVCATTVNFLLSRANKLK